MRPTCPRCRRPLRTCLCDLIRPIDTETDVLILQHPEEVGQAKGSATLLALSLARCHVWVGERFEPAALLARLHAEGRQPVLLYPRSANDPAPAATPTPPPHRLRLVVLDATWRKSRKLLHCNPVLRDLSRLALTAPAPSRYAALRKAQVPALQRSTLEATCGALMQLEPSVVASCGGLLTAFDVFVQRGQAHNVTPKITEET
jgi:DTW domain-containing protein